MNNRVRVFSAGALLAVALPGCGKEDSNAPETGSKAASVSHATRTPSGRTAAAPDSLDLLDAAAADDVKRVEALLESGADPNARSPQGSTPLAVAASLGNTEMMRLLVAAGADPELAAKRDITPLLAAIGAGKTEAVGWLLDAKAEIDTVTPNGVTPLMFAVVRNQPEIARLLIERGADVNARNSSGSSILILAITAGQGETAKRLIGKKADVNIQTSSNRTTALMMASHRDMRDAASLLLAAGARTDLKDAYGKTASDYAGSDQMRAILEKGAAPPPK